MCHLAHYFNLAVIFGLLFLNASGGSLKIISNDDVSKMNFSDVPEGATPTLIFVIPANCPSCGRYSKLLNDFKSDNLYAGQLYLLNSTQVPWGTTQKPPLVFLVDAERQIPYCGPVHYTHLMNAIHQFANGVRSALLNDANFEHDTQASTGSTTGDWLIVFDHLTQDLIRTYDGLSLSLRARGVSLGLVDPRYSVRTAKRFEVDPKSAKPPLTILLLRRAQMYQFRGSLHPNDYEKMLQFAVNDYASSEPLVIPRPWMLFDEFVDWTVELFLNIEAQHGRLAVMTMGVLALVITLCTIALVVATCFWFVSGSERQVDQQELVDQSDSSRPDYAPHEAGDDGGSHHSRKSKRD